MPVPKKKLTPIQHSQPFSTGFAQVIVIRKKRQHKEATQQVQLVRWLKEKGLMFTSLNNSFFGLSMGQLMKAKAQGLKAGLPDILIVLRANQSMDNRAHLIWAEMKPEKGGKISPEQWNWIEALNEPVDSHAVVCHGAERAKAVINNYLL